MTTKTSLLTGLLLAATALGISGCGPVVPLNPTWKDDVRPLVVARCVRCHDDTFHQDPALVDTDPATRDTPVSSFNYPETGSLNPLPPGLGLLVALGPQYVRGELPPPAHRMPPPPAAALEDWQVEIIEAWALSPR